MSWKIGAAANGVTAIAYFLISFTILRGLMRENQLRTNPLGTATSVIFFSCAVHHGGHTVHMLLPVFGIHVRSALSMRAAFDPEVVVWDIFTAAVGVYYWTLRRTYGALLKGPLLFADIKAQQRRALEINDDIVQSLAIIKYAAADNDVSVVVDNADRALNAARGIIAELIGSSDSPLKLGAGDLARQRATGAVSDP